MAAELKLWFDQDGYIVCLGNADFQPQPGWKTYQFGQHELRSLLGQRLTRYQVVKQDQGYQIVLRPRLTDAMEFHSIREVPTGSFLPKIQITSDTVTMLTARNTEQETDTFYVTAKRNPHVMYEKLQLQPGQPIPLVTRFQESQHSIYSQGILFGRYWLEVSE